MLVGEVVLLVRTGGGDTAKPWLQCWWLKGVVAVELVVATSIWLTRCPHNRYQIERGQVLAFCVYVQCHSFTSFSPLGLWWGVGWGGVGDRNIIMHGMLQASWWYEH